MDESERKQQQQQNQAEFAAIQHNQMVQTLEDSTQTATVTTNPTDTDSR